MDKPPLSEFAPETNASERIDRPVESEPFELLDDPYPDRFDPRDELVWQEVSKRWMSPRPAKWLGRLFFVGLGGVLAVAVMFAMNRLRGEPAVPGEPIQPTEQTASASTSPGSTPDEPPVDLPDLPPPPLDAAPAAPRPRTAPPAPVATAPPPSRSTRPLPPAAPSASKAALGRGAPVDPALDPPLAAWRAGFATTPPRVAPQPASGATDTRAPSATDTRATATTDARPQNAPGTRFPDPTEVRLPGANEVRLSGVNEVRLPRPNEVRVPAATETRAVASAAPPAATPPAAASPAAIPQTRVTAEEPRAVAIPPRQAVANEAPSAASTPRPSAAIVNAPINRPAPPDAGARSATSAIENTLARYRDAFNKLDVNAASRVWPSVNGRTLSKAFERLRQQQVSFDQCQIDVGEVRAEARCSGTARYVPRVGSSSTQIDQRQWRFSLAKRGEEWLIQSVEAR